MKKTLGALITSAMLAITMVPFTTHVASAAATANTAKLNGEGFRNCKAQGDTGYTAIVRGLSSAKSTRNGDFGKFYLRNCFQTKAECKSYVKNVPNILLGVSSITYSSCKARA